RWPRRQGRGGRAHVLAERDGVLREAVHEVHVVAVQLHPSADLLPRERAAVEDELQAESARAGARAARAGGQLADIAEPVVEEAEGLVKPVDDPGVGALGRRADRVALELIDGQPAIA